MAELLDSGLFFLFGIGVRYQHAAALDVFEKLVYECLHRGVEGCVCRINRGLELRHRRGDFDRMPALARCNPVRVSGRHFDATVSLLIRVLYVGVPKIACVLDRVFPFVLDVHRVGTKTPLERFETTLVELVVVARWRFPAQRLIDLGRLDPRRDRDRKQDVGVLGVHHSRRDEKQQHDGA